MSVLLRMFSLNILDVESKSYFSALSKDYLRLKSWRVGEEGEYAKRSMNGLLPRGIQTPGHAVCCPI